MVNYFRTPEMQQGHGWRCPNCNKMLAVKIKGNCLVQMICGRCHSFISIKLNEPVNWGKKEEQEIKVGGTV